VEQREEAVVQEVKEVTGDTGENGCRFPYSDNGRGNAAI
jgi:hypothetical protein